MCQSECAGAAKRRELEAQLEAALRLIGLVAKELGCKAEEAEIMAALVDQGRCIFEDFRHGYIAAGGDETQARGKAYTYRQSLKQAQAAELGTRTV